MLFRELYVQSAPCKVLTEFLWQNVPCTIFDEPLCENAPCRVFAGSCGWFCDAKILRNTFHELYSLCYNYHDILRNKISRSKGVYYNACKLELGMIGCMQGAELFDNPIPRSASHP